jgi:hypothetical protein
MLYPKICLEGMGKSTNSLSQENWFPGWDLEHRPLEHKAEVLTARPDAFGLCYLIRKIKFITCDSSTIIWVLNILYSEVSFSSVHKGISLQESCFLLQHELTCDISEFVILWAIGELDFTAYEMDNWYTMGITWNSCYMISIKSQLFS